MQPRPPPLPTAVLQRVVKIATLDGWSIVIVSGLATLATAWGADLWGSVIGALVCLAGLIELTGARNLKRGKASGLSKLIIGQLLLLSVIWIYVGVRLWTQDDSVLNAMLTPETLRQLSQLGVDTRQLKELLHLVMPLTYGVIAVVTLVYQGGLAWFYHRQKGSIMAALK